MRVIGILATVVIGVVVVVGLVVAIASIPDIKRYLKIRQM